MRWGSWYCGPEREFEDEATLVQHQKTKHFQCPECKKKLGSAPQPAPLSAPDTARALQRRVCGCSARGHIEE
jgi:hypothetical protein